VRNKFSAKLARLDSFSARIVKKRVQLRLDAFLFFLEIGDLLIDRNHVIALVQLHVAARRFSVFEFLQVRELLVSVSQLFLQLIDLLAQVGSVLSVRRLC